MAETNSPNIYVCTEQDNDVKESRLSVLLFRDQQAMTQASSSVATTARTPQRGAGGHHLGAGLVPGAARAPGRQLSRHRHRRAGRGVLLPVRP